MNIKIEEINKNCKCCFVYIDSLDDELKKIISSILLEIVKGKTNEDLAHKYNSYNQSLTEAAKYITQKNSADFKLGIVGELLAHIILRQEPLKQQFYSISPTIGYSDSKGTFFKGFDGCYCSEGALWLLEVKGKHDTTVANLDKDNKEKLKIASGQLHSEANDENINRWDIAKNLLINQCSQDAIDENGLYALLNSNKKNSYNQLLTAMLICTEGEFNLNFIKGYFTELIHKNVSNQKILLISIRNYDYQDIIDYIKTL